MRSYGFVAVERSANLPVISGRRYEIIYAEFVFKPRSHVFFRVFETLVIRQIKRIFNAAVALPGKSYGLSAFFVGNRSVFSERGNLFRLRRGGKILRYGGVRKRYDRIYVVYFYFFGFGIFRIVGNIRIDRNDRPRNGFITRFLFTARHTQRYDRQ